MATGERVWQIGFLFSPDGTFETDESTPVAGLVLLLLVWLGLFSAAISYTRNHKSGNLICAPRDDQFKAAPAKCDQLSRRNAR